MDNNKVNEKKVGDENADEGKATFALQKPTWFIFLFWLPKPLIRILLKKHVQKVSNSLAKPADEIELKKDSVLYFRVENAIKRNQKKILKNGLRPVSEYNLDKWLGKLQKKTKLRQATEVLQRMRILTLLEVISEAPDDLENLEFNSKLANIAKVENWLLPDEKEILINHEPMPAKMVGIYNWYIESALMMAWYLNLPVEITSTDKLLDTEDTVNVIYQTIISTDNPDKKKPAYSYRSREPIEVIELLDYYQREIYNLTYQEIKEGVSRDSHYNQYYILFYRIKGLRWLLYGDLDWTAKNLVTIEINIPEV